MPLYRGNNWGGRSLVFVHKEGRRFQNRLRKSHYKRAEMSIYGSMSAYPSFEMIATVISLAEICSEMESNRFEGRLKYLRISFLELRMAAM